MYYKIWILISILFITGCQKEKNIYYEREGKIYKFNLETQKAEKIAESKGNILWNINFDERGEKYLFINDRHFKLGKEEFMEGNVEIYSFNDRKLIEKIGNPNFNECNAHFFKDKIIYLSNEFGESVVSEYDTNTKKSSTISDKTIKSIYPVIGNKREMVFYQGYNFEKSKWEIYCYSFKDKHVEKFEDSGMNLEYPSISPKETFIAFEEADADKSYINLYNFETKKLKRITTTGKEHYPSFSNDEKNLVYVSEGNLYICKLEDLSQKKATEYNENTIVSNPRWYDNYKIVYDKIEGENTTVEIIDINSLEKRELVSGKISGVF